MYGESADRGVRKHQKLRCFATNDYARAHPGERTWSPALISGRSKAGGMVSDVNRRDSGGDTGRFWGKCAADKCAH